jgi:hypothetical protein
MLAHPCVSLGDVSPASGVYVSTPGQGTINSTIRRELGVGQRRLPTTTAAPLTSLTADEGPPAVAFRPTSTRIPAPDLCALPRGLPFGRWMSLGLERRGGPDGGPAPGPGSTKNDEGGPST